MGHAGKEEIKVCGWGYKWRLIKDMLPKTLMVEVVLYSILCLFKGQYLN